MTSHRGYVPPAYMPLGQSLDQPDEENPSRHGTNQMETQWSSGICACCDDMQSCCIGLFCPCILFGKNAEFLGSGTFIGSCVTHFILWAIVNTTCCLLTDCLALGLPGFLVASYACGHRKALRSKYNLQEAPCGDFTTHFFCHMCALCQEYREIREKSGDSEAMNLTVVTAPPIQAMQSDSK